MIFVQCNWVSKLLSIHCFIWAVVVAQLEEPSLPIPDVHGSNPVIGKIYIEHFLSVLKRQKSRKEAGTGPFF